MAFTFAHNNFNVLDLEKEFKFYQDALGLEVVREKKTPDFTLAYLGDKKTPHQLELTWLKDRKKPYDLGENEFHLAFATVQILPPPMPCIKKMGCICYENPAMGIYFINDPDGYWLEIIPAK
jgi:lactoylglutathione lyase